MIKPLTPRTIRLTLLAALTAALFLPFVNKPVSSDSFFYLDVARQITVDPLRPFDFTIVFASSKERGWDVANNPPLASYIMALVIAVFGEKEAWLHLVFLVFPLLSVLAFYRLSEEMGADPLISSLLLIASPAFFVNGTDILLDLPLLMFMLLAVYLVVRGEKNGSWASSLLGWSFAGCALLTKYTAVLLVPLLLGWLLLNRRPWRRYLPALIPLGLLAAWTVHNQVVYGAAQIFGKTHAVGFHWPIVKEIPLFTYLGGAFLFPVSIPYILAATRERRHLFAGLGFFAALDILFNTLSFPPFQSFLLAFFMTNGIALAFLALRSGLRGDLRPETIFPAAWFILFGVFFASVSAIIAVRYLLPMLPPLILILVRAFPDRKRLFAVTAAAGMILSLCLAHADYRWAAAYRDTAERIAQKYKGPVYFTGHLGFQYYMEKHGFTPVVSNEAGYPAGSLIVTSTLPVPQDLHPAVRQRLAPLEVITVRTKNPFRTISPRVQAGFHLNLYGLLPYSFSPWPLERFTVYRVEDLTTMQNAK